MSKILKTGENKLLTVNFVLLEQHSCDWEQVLQSLENKWGISAECDVINDGISFVHSGIQVYLSFVNAPIPNDEAKINAEKNFLWEGAAASTEKHQSHVVVAVLGHDNVVEHKKMLVKVASSVMEATGAIGIYRYPTVLPSDYYIHFAEELDDEQLPIPLWVHVGIYPAEDESLLCAYTFGLSDFGSKELEVLDSKADALTLYSFLVDVAANIIGLGANIEDETSVGFTAQENFAVSVSDGIAVDGPSIKIRYDGEDTK